MGRALATTTALLVVVANIREQPGETSGLDMSGHLATLRAHLPDDVTIDVVVANDGPVPQAVARHVDALAPPTAHESIGAVVTGPLADARGNHDAGALAELLASLPVRDAPPSAAIP